MIIGFIKRQQFTKKQPVIVSDSINYLSAKFVFQTSEWDEMIKFAHFQSGDDVYDFLLDGDELPKEASLNLYAGNWKVYIHGDRYVVGNDGSVKVVERATTNSQEIKVVKYEKEGSVLPEIGFDVAEQIAAVAEDAKRIATSVRNEADQGMFDGVSVTHEWDGTVLEVTSASGTSSADLKGQKGDKGEPGKDGYTPQKNVDYFDGITPHIGENENWWIGDIDTGVKAGGVSSWNDLTDKPFYAEPLPTYEVLPETTVEGEGDLPLPTPLNLIVGQKYVVKWNGIEYSSVAVEVSTNGMTVYCLGDVYPLTGGEIGTAPTGEPFIIMDAGMEIAEGVYGVMRDFTGATTVTLSITGGGYENIKKLDNKYLDLEWIPAPVEKEEVVYDGNISLSNSGTTDVVLSALFLLTAGSEYKITTSEGVNCKCTAKSATLTFDSGKQILSWIGNNNLSSYIFSNNGIEVEDTGEEFCYYTLQMSDGSSAYCFTSAERGKRDITVKAIEIAKAKEPIPVEYLPKSVPYVLESEEDIVEVWPETTYEFEEGNTSLEFIIDEAIYNAIVPNETYIVNWNGTEYECVSTDASALGGEVQGAFLGNIGAMTGGANTGEPFVIGVSLHEVEGEPQYVGVILSADGSASVTLSVSKGQLAKIQKLDERCLPETVATKAYVDEMLGVIENGTY